jgi:hypothetical protein
VSPGELARRAGVAIRLAFNDEERGHDSLERYLAEMDDADLEALRGATEHLGDAIGDVLGRRHP